MNDSHQELIYVIVRLVDYLVNLCDQSHLPPKRTIGVFFPTPYKDLIETNGNILWVGGQKVDLFCESYLVENQLLGMVRGFEDSREIFTEDPDTGDLVGTGIFEKYEKPLISLQYYANDPTNTPKLIALRPDLIKIIDLSDLKEET